ncbi:MAG: ABC transporter ATP-binding protein [Anaerolineales bacterium]|nr:ABC transporter ATP-binding protein [Anaerolineales bacterium]
MFFWIVPLQQRSSAIKLLIEAKGLTKYFDDFLAVDCIDLEVYPGEILALLGPNGAGKTTTIRLLASILKPSSGWTRIDGVDVITHPSEIRGKMGILTEHHGLYSRMRAEEYLTFFGEAYGMSSEQIERNIEKLLDQFGLENVRSRRLGEYSKGMTQKLAMARALLHDPAIVLLDEPTSAMDPASARQVRESICTLRTSSRAIIICTHNLNEAEFLADKIAIMSEGRIVSQGTIAGLRRNLLGRPVVELRYRGDDRLVRSYIPETFDLFYTAPGVVHYFSDNPDKDNPRILNRLFHEGIDVLSVAEIRRSLEDIYLQVVKNNGSGEAV